MTIKAKWFTKQLRTDFESEAQVHALYSEADSDGRPMGGVWLKFHSDIDTEHIYVQAETKVPLGAFRARISPLRSVVVPLDLTPEEANHFREHMTDCPVVVLRKGQASSDDAMFWVLMQKPELRIIRLKSTGFGFVSEVRAHEKRGQRRRVSITDQHWTERGMRFLEVQIADLPPCLGGPDPISTLGSC